jgi:hypothetical protein
MFASQVSSDLDVGRRPELKSIETCDAHANVIVIEIKSHLCSKPLKQVVQLLHSCAIRDTLRIVLAPPAPYSATGDEV